MAAYYEEKSFYSDTDRKIIPVNLSARVVYRWRCSSAETRHLAAGEIRRLSRHVGFG